MHTDNSDLRNNSNSFNVDNNIDVDENFYGYEDFSSDNDNNSEDKKTNKSKKMIIIVIVALVILLCIGGLVFFLARNNSGEETPGLTPSVTLSDTSFELTVGSSKKITYTVENIDTEVEVTWSTSDKSIATVSTDGTVKGVKAGTATITATYTIDGTEYQKTCFVTIVKAGSVTAPTVTLSKTKLELKVGASEKITYTVKNNSSNISVTWSSSNKSIATVSSNGTVKGVKEGTTTITATYVVNGKEYKKTCSVTVKKSDSGGTTKDTTDPTLSYTITSGKENTWVNTDVSIKVTASDNSGSVTVKYTTNCSTDCKYTTVSNGVIKVSTAGSSIVRIVATDKSGNSTEEKVTVMIDKIKPNCSLTVSETGTLSAKYNDTGSSGISYYGFSSSYSGTSGNTKTLSSAGTFTYYVKDKAGNTYTCSLVVKTKTQYRYQECNSCKTCKAAGCKYFGAWNAISGSEFDSTEDKSTPKSGTLRTGCVFNTTTNKFNCKKYERDCVTYYESCDKCGGCNSWGQFSDWTDTKYTESSSRKVETKTVYYGN